MTTPVNAYVSLMLSAHEDYSNQKHGLKENPNYKQQKIDIAKSVDETLVKNIRDALMQNIALPINEEYKRIIKTKHWGEGIIQATLLHDAVKWNFFKTAELFLQNRANAETPPTGRETPLALAFKKKHHSIITLLINSNITLTKPLDGYGNNALHFAVRYNNPESIDLLKEKIQDIKQLDVVNSEGKTPFVLALHLKKESIALKLLKNGFNAHSKDENGNTLLHKTIKFPKIVKELVDVYKVDPNAANNFGETPYFLSLVAGNAETAEVLRLAGADISRGTNRNGDTTLTAASYKSMLEEAKCILEKNPELLNKKGGYEKTPLAYAAISSADSQKYMLFLLGKEKIDINASDFFGWTPLHCAVNSGSLENVKVLIEKGADVNALSEDGTHPLDHATSPEISNYLEQKGARRAKPPRF